MQKVKKVTGILVIALFYCISAGFVNTYCDHAEYTALSKAERNVYSSVALMNMHCHTVPGENQVKTISSLAAKFIRIEFCKLSVICDHFSGVTGQRPGRSFFYVAIFFMQQYKKSILFPFHNFW
ncbi:MAG TPA: hypothetical protein PLT47_08790 [Bacteroidales bacterium]|nr:hypothetical protein [Bacteroidales bacterium]HQI70832.1 hypothetical protein [Bacteroidales bacterium]